MPLSQHPELYWLTLTALVTALMWLPYIFSLITQMGLLPALTDGQHVTPLEKAWAGRAKRAHANAVENLVIFAPLVLTLVVLEATTELTATLATTYFGARIVHWVVYLFGVPVVRTLAFAVGLLCQLGLALVLLGMI